MREELDGEAMKGVVTYDGLDLIISSMESTDAIAIKAEKGGTPIYVVGKEEEKEEDCSLLLLKKYREFSPT